MSQLKESDIVPQGVQALQASGCHVFRNNIGVAKYGQQWVRYGVGGKGGPDHLGFIPIRITKEMVGHYIAVFVAAEFKRPVSGVPSSEQIAFIDNVRAAGGIAGFPRSYEDARALVMDWMTRFKRLERGVKKS